MRTKLSRSKKKEEEDQDDDHCQNDIIRFFDWACSYIEMLIIPFVVLSILFTPIEFSFYRGLTHLYLKIPDYTLFVIFGIDFIFRRCNEVAKWFFKTKNRRSFIDLKTWFWIVVEATSSLSWDFMSKKTNLEVLHYRLIFRLLCWMLRIYYWLKKIKNFLKLLLVTRAAILIIFDAYLAHLFACTLYFIAAILPEQKEDKTWIGSLEESDQKLYPHFKNIVFWRRYNISIYFAIVTMATVGYGDIKPVNDTERFVVSAIIFISSVFQIFFGCFIVMAITQYIKKKNEEKSKKDDSQRDEEKGTGDHHLHVQANPALQELFQKVEENKDFIGLRNRIGENNCFLNVIIQSLWHLRTFQEELLKEKPSLFTNDGNYDVTGALHDIFAEIGDAIKVGKIEVDPIKLRSALHQLCSKDNRFQVGKMDDAMEALDEIFECFHTSYKNNNCMSICNDCIAHKLFGIRDGRATCGTLLIENKISSCIKTIDSSDLKSMKTNFLDNNQPCEKCGRTMAFIINNSPKLFTIRFWYNKIIQTDHLPAMMKAISTEVDLGNIYSNIRKGRKHNLVSMDIDKWEDVVRQCKMGKWHM